MALREILAKFGFDVDKSKLDATNNATDGLAKKIKAVAGAFAAGAVVAVLKSFISELKETASNVRRTSQMMGVSTHEAQQWTTAAELAGVGAETFATGIKFLQKNMVGAAESGGDMAQVFKKLGVDVRDVHGNIRPTGEALKDVIGKIAEIKNPAERTAATLKVFGRSGADLLPLINKGAAGLDELLGKLDELGGGLSDEAINALKGQSRASKEYDVALLSLKSRLVTQILPTFTSLIQFGTKIAVGFAKAAQGTNVFKAAAVVMGTIAVGWAVSIYAAYLPFLAMIAGLVLLVDDLITLFQGGDSVIGAFLDKLFGEGTAKSVVGRLIDEINELKRTVERTQPTVDQLAKGQRSSNDAEGFWSHVWGRILRGVKQFGSDFASGLSDVWWAFSGWAGEMAGAVGGWFVGIGQQIARGAKRFAKDFVDGLSDMIWAVKQLGSDLIDGLIGGIEAGAGKVVDAFKKMGKSAFSAIRGVFDSHSPSRALFKFAKYDLAENALAAGLVSGQPAVKDAMGGMYSVPRTGGSSRGDTAIQQTNYHTYQIDGADKSIANQVRDGAARANNDDRRELLAALETTG